MAAQNYKNHRHFIPMYHFALSFIIILCIAGSIWNLKNALHVNHGKIPAIVIFLLSDVVLAMFFFSRGFALRAQDRAIRLEENFRHFVLTGKALDSRLRMSQVIALRFAHDDEFVSLSKKAAEENMNANDIKKAIQNWRPDHHRA